MADTDIDQFIQQQKAKLAHERQNLNNETDTQSRNLSYDQHRPERQKWAQFDAANAPAPAEQKREFTPQDSGLPLTNMTHQERQRLLAIERNREYNAMLEKKGQKPRSESRQEAPPRRQGLDIGHYEDERKLLDIERRQEYLKYMEKQNVKKTNSSPNRGQQGSYDDRHKEEDSNPENRRYSYQVERKRLAEERKKEYNDLMQAKLAAKDVTREPEIDNPSIIPFNRAEQDKRKARLLEEERKREYNQVKAQIDNKPRQREFTPPETYGLPVGNYEKQRQKEREQQEYKAMLDMQQEQQRQMNLLQQGVPYERISKLSEKESYPSGFDNYNHDDAFGKPDQQVPYREAFEPVSDYQPQNQRSQSRVQFDPENYAGREEYLNIPRDENEAPLLNLELSRKPGDRLFDYKKDLEEEKERYKREWLKDAVLGEVEPGGDRKKWRPAVKLSPRGLLDTDHIVAKIERDEALERYKAEWQRDNARKQQATSKAPTLNMTRGGKLNTDSIVDRVTGGNGDQDFMPQRNQSKGFTLDLQRNEVRNNNRNAQQENTPRETEKNISNIFAEAKKDASEHRKKWGTGNEQNPDVSENNHGNRGTSADYRKRLVEIRNKEYNDFLNKKKEGGKIISREWNSPVTAAEETPFPLGGYEQKQKDYVEQRKRELQEYMYKSQESPKYYVSQENLFNRVLDADFQETGLPLGSYEKVRQKMNEERKRDYQDHLRQNQSNFTYDTPRSQKQRDMAILIRDDGRQERAKEMEEKRNQEYNEMLANKNQANHAYNSPRSQRQRDVAILIKDDGRQERLRKLQEARNQEYNDMLANKQNSLPVQNDSEKPREDFLFRGLGDYDEKRKQKKHHPEAQALNMAGENKVDMTIRRGYQGGANLQQQTDDYKAKGLVGNESDSVKWKKIKERNDEYNEFLAQKNEKERNRFAHRKAPESNDSRQQNSIPGFSSNSAQKRRNEAQRNQEYNDMLQQQRQRGSRQGGVPPPKTGWATPDYGKLLEQNRGKEQSFRRANDIAFETDPQTRYTEWRYKEMDRDLAAKRKAYQRERYFNGQVPGYGILEDPNWLSPRNAHAERNYTHMNYNDAVTDDRGIPKLPTSRRSNNKAGGEYYYASLPLGKDTDSAVRRQKDEYRLDLERQMAETKQARQIERQEGLLVNNTGLGNPASSRVPKQRKAAPVNYDNILSRAGIEDDLSPRTNAILGRRQNTGDRRRFVGLNTGYQAQDPVLDLGILQSNNTRGTSLEPPAGLQYQPSTFITANAVPTLNNSVDEAYNFFATKNPLDPDIKQDVGQPFAHSEVVRGGPSQVPSLNLGGVTGDHGQASRVRFNDQSRRQPTAAQGMVFSTDDERKQEQRQNAGDYRAELQRQIAEKNMKKRLAKEDRERYELKMEEEAKNYDPFGKGGGGAPMRDTQGNVISDLRQMRNDNTQGLTGRSYKKEPSPRLAFDFDPSPGNLSRGPNSYRDDKIGPPPTQTTTEGDPTFARGGHGIFGMPKTDVEKVQADRYKIELKKQIEDKKAEEYRKKQLEKLEEEKEQRLLDEQRARMQAEYDEEQRRMQEKKEEARLKNEEMMRLAEDKKRELERQRQEEDDMRQEELRGAHERELRERQRAEEAQRGKSPPIPSLQGRDDKEEPKEQSKGAESPPIPAARTRIVEPDVAPLDTAPRAQSADVLNQLTRLRAELRKESDRVQTMLHDQEDDVEIYDPRQMHRPPPAPIVAGARPDIDVFETAMNRNAVAVRRTPGDRANSTVMADFSSLKNKHDSDSRKHFRNLYPTEPMSSDALEAQQAALLKQQEERLRNLKDRRALEDTSGLRIGRDLHSSSSQLHSNSAFVDVNGMAPFPDDFDDLPKRNDSARYRRRSRVPSSPRIERIVTPEINSRSTFGSQTSLNVDRLSRKNEDRLRKLRDMQGDDLSLYDPEDVLNRFMSKQDHNRPPSRNTLLDDTWMTAGSKQSKY